MTAARFSPALSLAQVFFNPAVLKATGPDPLLKYLASDNAREVDTQLVSGLRDFLFGPPGAGGLDLASLNLQRGRDHGLSDYNATRVAYGLSRLRTSRRSRAMSACRQIALGLRRIDALDLWVGWPGGRSCSWVKRRSDIPTHHCRSIRTHSAMAIASGMRRLFSGPQLQALEQTRLSDIIRRNTALTKLQDNVFFFQPTTLATLQAKPGFLPPALVNAPVPRSAPAPLDGTGNNPGHATWGAAGIGLLRFAPAAYEDSISTPAGSARPSARLISNALCDQTAGSGNARFLSDWIYGWGQFIDHDLDLTTTGDTAFDIAVPAGDPSFDPSNSGTR